MQKIICRWRPFYYGILAGFSLLIAGLAIGQSLDDPWNPYDLIHPEAATGYQRHELVRADNVMVSAANPFASQAGLSILKQGGNAIDAAIAMQLVLNLVEPQSSGIGGGGFALTYHAQSDELVAWDGRETAPLAVSEQQFLQAGTPMPFWEAVNSGLSVGVPGLVRMLARMHAEQGHLAWAELFGPAIQLATEGFPVSERLHRLLADNEALKSHSAAAAYFYDGNGQAWPVGHRLKNPAFARVLRKLAVLGPDYFYQGKLPEKIAATVREQATPGALAVQDFQAYDVKKRAALCMTYQEIYDICGMPAPSSGAVAVLQMLGILSHFPVADMDPNGALSVHYFSEAGRLAYADRDVYIADPDFVEVPQQALLDADYLAQRAALIRPDHTMGQASAGVPASVTPQGQDNSLEQPSTTHLVAVDQERNVVSMTTSIESAFGSKLFVNGFLLNNQLTDFAFSTKDDQGRPLANRVEPGKRPRSSMAPLIVFKHKQPWMAIGSPGGAAIINFVAKTVLGVIDWEMDLQQAIDLPHRGSRNQATELEENTPLTALKEPLEAMGHTVTTMAFPSGLQGIIIDDEGGLSGAADPRREGIALGR